MKHAGAGARLRISRPTSPRAAGSRCRGVARGAAGLSGTIVNLRGSSADISRGPGCGAQVLPGAERQRATCPDVPKLTPGTNTELRGGRWRFSSCSAPAADKADARPINAPRSARTIRRVAEEGQSAKNGWEFMGTGAPEPRAAECTCGRIYKRDIPCSSRFRGKGAFAAPGLGGLGSGRGLTQRSIPPERVGRPRLKYIGRRGP